MALKDINLIPDDILARRKMFRSLRLWSSVLAVFLLLISIYCGLQINEVLMIKPDGTHAAQVRNELQSKIETIKSIQQKYNRLLQKKARLTAPFQATPVSVPLQTIAENLTPGTWLRQLDILPVDNKSSQGRFKRIDIRGESSSYSDITRFLQALQDDDLFQAVELKYTHKKKDSLIKMQAGQLRSVIQFRIQGRLDRKSEQS